MAIFRTFFFKAILDQENVFYDILERKNAFPRYKNKKFKKTINWLFSKGVSPWVWSKNGQFCNFFFLSYLGQENVSYDILERQNLFLGYKNKKFKTSKNWLFPKELTKGFGPKMAIFPTFFLVNLHKENVFYDILKKKRLSRL